MATLCLVRRPVAKTLCPYPSSNLLRPRFFKQSLRLLQTSIATDQPKAPSFGFAFEYSSPRSITIGSCLYVDSIDGVLLRSSKPLPRAHRALSYLQHHRIPFILLTNGGGKSEQERVQQLAQLLEVSLDTSMFVQSHTPFAELANENSKDNLRNKCILVIGGEGDKCRRVAEG